MFGINLNLSKKPVVFYIKWLGTAGSLLTVFLTSYDYVPYNKHAGLATALLWTLCGVFWKEPALVIPNLIIALIYFSGLV